MNQFTSGPGPVRMPNRRTVPNPSPLNPSPYPPAQGK
jgi:hypothetical protein